MRMRRIVTGLLLLSALVLVPTRAQTPDLPRPRLADVNIRLFTAGPRQPVEEIGAFTSSLPLGKAGTLHRLVTITNETRKATLSLELLISLTPTVDDSGVLHCVILSEATPQDGKAGSRARDLTFSHPGEQVMELYADSAMQTRVMLAVDTHLSTAEAIAPPSSFPLLLFTVKVEQWSGPNREEIENIQLQSLDGKTVGHDYSRRIPRWVDASVKDDEPVPQESLKPLDFAQGTPVVQAGEDFSIPIQSKEDKKGKKKEDQGRPQNAQPPSKKLVWQQESYHLTLLPVVFEGGVLRLKVAVSGQFMDRTTKQLLPPIQREVEKSLLADQPIPFYLTRETPQGPEGYVVWVVPRWTKSSASPPPLPASGPESPPAPIGPQAAPGKSP